VWHRRHLLSNRGSPDRVLLARMRDAVRHRGPDETGEYVDGPIALGHRRLTIIDLSSGRQPIGNEDGSVQIVYNGEVYNFPELHASLEAAGHRFATRTDTEVVVHLYEEVGEAVVERLNGMFAFALWDGGRRRLFLARDRAGIKPLYYAHLGGRFAFASEIRPLLLLPWISRAIDPQALDAYLANGYVPAPGTLFRDIRKLPAAHTLSVDADGLTLRRYWVPRSPDAPPASVDELCERLADELDRSVRMHLVSDVPVGAFLSGGLDSSIVVALMRRHGTGRLKTFSVGIETGDAARNLDESGFARLVARHFGTDHYEIRLHPEDVPDLLTAAARYLDEPVSDPAAIPTFKLAELARTQVKVVLTGEGADETWGGYDVFRKADLVARYRRLPGWFRRSVSDPILSSLPGPGAGLVSASQSPGYLARLRHLEPVARRSLYTADAAVVLANEVDADEAGLDPRDPFGSVARDLIDRHLAERLLLKVDRMTMAHSLEARVPYLDHRLIEFSFTVPARLKVRGPNRKYLLRRAFQADLPLPVLQRRKHPFDLPCASLLRTTLATLADDVFAGDLVADCIDRQSVARLWRRHRDGSADHTTELWALLSVGLWNRSVAAA
jgi:asparagine synthase (glutamine-hydrolysing)